MKKKIQRSCQFTDHRSCRLSNEEMRWEWRGKEDLLGRWRTWKERSVQGMENLLLPPGAATNTSLQRWMLWRWNQTYQPQEGTGWLPQSRWSTSRAFLTPQVKFSHLSPGHPRLTLHSRSQIAEIWLLATFSPEIWTVICHVTNFRWFSLPD